MKELEVTPTATPTPKIPNYQIIVDQPPTMVQDTITKASVDYPIEKPTTKLESDVPVSSIFYDLMKQYSLMDAATGLDQHGHTP